MNTKFVETALPCPCGKSSDAYALNEDGSGKCFSCGDFFPNKKKGIDINTDIESEQEFKGTATLEYTNLRGISANTRRFYEAPTKIIGGIAYSTGYKYENGSYKVRKLGVPKKEAFSTIGEIGKAHIFGKDKFPPGSKSAIIITEGEEDAMAAYEMLGNKYAAVSVKGGSTAFGDVRAERDYINSFDKIILALDNDSIGEEATRQITGAGLFDYDKIYRVEFGVLKDSNDFIFENRVSDFIKIIETAKRYTPSNVINDFSDISKALDREDSKQIGDYPFEDLNNSLKGFHGGEFILLKGLEGIGKTEICRATMYHNLGVVRQATIFLEESTDITIKGVATYELERPCVAEDAGISKKEIFEAYRKALAYDDNMLYIHTHFSSEDDNEIIDTIRFLVTVAGCKIIYLDNLTMLVTGREGEDERLRIDRIIRRLRDLVNELHFCLFLVAHVNDNNQTRGSRLPDKLANTVIIMERNIEAGEISEKNYLKLTVQKARTQGAKTGHIGGAFFDPITYKLRDVHKTSTKIPILET